MRQLLRLPSLYLSLPMLIACGLTLLTYDLPHGYAEGLLLLIAMALLFVALDGVVGVQLPRMQQFRARNYAGTREAFVALAFAGLILLFCALDLTLFPIPLLTNPSSYAVMEGGRAHVRHISDMCWVLPPIGLLCARSRWLRNTLILVGFVFPVLVIDRNRIFAALYSYALVLVLRRDPARPLPWKMIWAVALSGAVIFSVLGMLRSGSLDFVTLPFSAFYRDAPQGVKWLLLYITAGPYNFASLLAKHYVNADFLINQLVPLQGSVATLGTGIPLDAPNINVGTEFLPFLLAFGPGAAMAAFFVLYVMLLWSTWHWRRRLGLFSLLIFLRVSYCCVMAPFAPQAFTWTNVGFILVGLVMPVFGTLLPNRRAGGALLDARESLTSNA